MQGLGRAAQAVVLCLWVFSTVAIAAAEEQQRGFDYFALVRYVIPGAGHHPLRIMTPWTNMVQYQLNGGACAGSGIPATAHFISAGTATTRKGEAARSGPDLLYS